MLKYLTYVSRQSHALSDTDLEKLLEQARKNNRQQNITGMLIYLEGLFIQYIEGSEIHLQNLYEKIEKDSRHKKVTLLDSENNRNREFKDWSMAFKKLSKNKAFEISGYRDLNRQNIFEASGTKNHPALDLLSNYVKNL